MLAAVGVAVPLEVLVAMAAVEAIPSTEQVCLEPLILEAVVVVYITTTQQLLVAVTADQAS
jgi:hypothetical protein